MGASCLLSGLPSDPLVDAEVWRYDLVLGQPALGSAPEAPFDLTGSDLTIVFRTVMGWDPVSTLSTIPTWPGIDGTLTITDAAAGKVSLVSDPWVRSYRIPVSGFGFAVGLIQVTGDLMRLAKGDAAARPEYLGFIRFPLRAGTTQWLAPATS